MNSLRGTLTATLMSLTLVTCQGDVPPPTVSAQELCKSWRHLTVSQQDKITEATASKMEGSNYARVAWDCVYGKNAAKKK